MNGELENPCIGCLVDVMCDKMCKKSKVWYDLKTIIIPDAEFNWQAYYERRDGIYRRAIIRTHMS